MALYDLAFQGSEDKAKVDPRYAGILDPRVVKVMKSYLAREKDAAGGEKDAAGSEKDAAGSEKDAAEHERDVAEANMFYFRPQFEPSQTDDVTAAEAFCRSHSLYDLPLDDIKELEGDEEQEQAQDQKKEAEKEIETKETEEKTGPVFGEEYVEPKDDKEKKKKKKNGKLPPQEKIDFDIDSFRRLVRNCGVEASWCTSIGPLSRRKKLRL